MKYYCSSQAQNSIPGELGKKIRVKFNKSTFCKPGKVIKRKIDTRKVINTKDGGSGQNQSEAQREGTRRKQERTKGFDESEQNSELSSEPVSYLASKRNLFQSKSNKGIGKLQIESAKDGEAENYFSVTSDDKSKKLTLLPSVMSLGTDNSLYSNQQKDNDEFNLYNVDKSHRTNNSGSQMDIIYNKRRQNKRKGVQTENERQPVKKKPHKQRKQETRGQPKSFKNMMMGLRGKRWKKRSFHAEQNN